MSTKIKKKPKIKATKKNNKAVKAQPKPSPRIVSKKSNDDLPGYPHYSVKEDILNAAKDERIDVDVENLTREGKGFTESQADSLSKAAEETSGNEIDIELVPGTDADVTEEDIKALGDKDLEMDGGDDELLPKLKIGPDTTGDDLDVPGSTPDNASAEDAGSEDEENKYYSRGQE